MVTSPGSTSLSLLSHTSRACTQRTHTHIQGLIITSIIPGALNVEEEAEIDVPTSDKIKQIEIKKKILTKIKFTFM